MSRDSAYLLDILKAAHLAMDYLGEKTKKQFFRDTQCQDAVIRRLEIIGEAAGRISKATTAKFPNIPWKKIKAMRNIMIHEYDDVDLMIVWDTVRNDLPSLVSLIKPLVPPEEES
jgi:uncharacterized protein with HEPN domain